MTLERDSLKAKRLVQEGYEAVAAAYLHARSQQSRNVAFLEELTERLRPGALVLDAGCGAGMPIARALGQRYRVVGADFARAQLALARRNAPLGQYALMDITELGFADGSFDAVVSYYALIHVPRSLHEQTLRGFHRALKPGGLLLACMGKSDLPQDFDDFFGAPMYWSHYDAEHNLAMAEECGFDVLRREIIRDDLPNSQAAMGDTAEAGSHLFLLAQRQG